MVITFAQYSILTATYRCATYSQVEKWTSFDRMMIDYYIMGMLNIGLIKASDENASDTTCYELTDIGVSYIEDYERANPNLIIKRSVE